MKQPRKYTDLYGAEYEELQEKGRLGRSPEEQARYKALQKTIGGKRRAQWAADRLRRLIAAGAAPSPAAPSPPEPVVIPDPDPTPETPPTAEAEAVPPPPSTATATQSAASPEPAPPPQAAQGPRVIPPPDDPPPPPMSEEERAAWRRKVELFLAEQDLAWEAWLRPQLGGMAPPLFLRRLVQYCAVEYAHRKEWLYAVRAELTDGQLLAGAIGGSVLVYGVPSGLAALAPEEVKQQWQAAATEQQAQSSRAAAKPPPPGMRPHAEEAEITTPTAETASE